MMTELVAPGGSLEKLKFALEYGADAVYAGREIFSLREKAANLSLEDWAAAREETRKRGKKLFLTANMFFHNADFAPFVPFFKEMASIGLDGVIVSDLGAISWIREHYPDVAVHVSTQANTTNANTVKFYSSLGVKRIVLARELTIEEIAEIRDQVPDIELEAFVHGAMCIAYSGRCLLSNYLTNPALYGPSETIGGRPFGKTRDANRGDCSQSCRWSYKITEVSRGNEWLEVEETERGTALMSSRDLNLSAHIGRLLKAGVNSFKIEGRMKSLYYVSNVTRVYRHAIDRALEGKAPDPEMLKELEKVSHRVYTTGFYFHENLALSPTPNAAAYVRETMFLGWVKSTDGKSALIETKNPISIGDELEFCLPDGKNVALKNYQLFKDGVEQNRVQSSEEIRLVWREEVALCPMAIIRREQNCEN